LDDFVILKMDIEGAEFHVLPKLITEGTIHLIDDRSSPDRDYPLPDWLVRRMTPGLNIFWRPKSMASP
jgi:hypothetical protein